MSESGDPRVGDAVQPHQHTALFREHRVLEAAKRLLPPAPRILSFGCSIGYELLSLRLLFPQAAIFGCDVSADALTAATEMLGSQAHVFASSADEIRQRGPFDFICALSSLCINPAPPNIAQAFPFSRFDGLTSFLADNLSPGGVFAFQNMSYPFRFTGAAQMFDPVRSDVISRNGFIDLFAPDGRRLIKREWSGVSDYHRVEDPSDLDDWDLIDCVFRKRLLDEVPAVRPLEMRAAPLDDLPVVIEWTTSDLTLLTGDKRLGCIENRQDNRVCLGADGRPVGERRVSRSRLRDSTPLTFGPVRITLPGTG